MRSNTGTLFDATTGAIRDTAARNSPSIGNALVGAMLLNADNALNQSVSLQYQGSFDGSTWYSLGAAIAVAAGATRQDTLSEFWPVVRCVATASVAPASGALVLSWAWRQDGFGGTGSLASVAAAASSVVDTELPAAAAAADAQANPTAPAVRSNVQGFNGATWDRLRSGGDNADALATSTLGLLRVLAENMGWNGATFDRIRAAGDNADALAGIAAGLLRTLSEAMVYNGSTWDRLRTPNVFKIVSGVVITAGTGATIWTPTAGKKFRLMGWSLCPTVGSQLIFCDNAVGSPFMRTGGVSANLAGAPPSGLGNGFLSGAADRVLVLDLSTSATVSGMVFGTEE